MSPIPIPHSLQFIRLHPRDFISPSPSPQSSSSSSSKGSSSFTSNPSLPWIIIGIVVGLTVLATSTTVLIIYYNRCQRQKTNPNPNHQPQLITPTTTQLQQQNQSSPLTLNFLRRKSAPATQFEQEELQRASMIRKSYASRSWNSLSLDSQMSISMSSQLSPTRTFGTYGSSSRVNTLERVNTTNMNMTNTNTNNTYNEEDMDLEMETPTTPTELRGTTATAEDDGTEGGGSRLKDDWKAWEARVKLERSVSGELHPAVCAGAGAESGAETEEVAVVPRTVVARTTTRGGVPIPPRRHPGRVASSMNMI